MIPQLAAAPVAGPAQAGLAQGSAASGDADSPSPLALVFGDLLEVMAAGGELPPPATAQPGAAAEPDAEASDAVSASILALLSSIDAAAEPMPVQVDEAQGDPLDGLWWLLSEGRLPANGTRAAAASLAESRGGPPTVLAGGTESRLAGTESVLPAVAGSSTPSPPTSALPQGVLDALHSLAPSGQQPAAAETGNSNTLAALMQASAPDRQLETTAGRLPTSSPLPPQDLRATLSQTLEQVAWMSREGVHQARLQLEPAHLGRVDIWLDLEGGEARLHLGSQQPQVREALEAVLPRLRDALAEHGMSLADASVSHSGREQSSADAGHGESTGAAAGVAEDADAHDRDDTRLHSVHQSGMLDTYA